jgi:hypothetical protein
MNRLTLIPRSHTGTRRAQQRGQAMIETIVAAALVLVPLFLAIPVIAKYQDIRSHTVQSARYAAWERTVWFGGDAAATMGIGTGTFSNKWHANEKGDAAIHAEIGKRILSKNGGAFQTGTDKSASGSMSTAEMWRDRRGNTLLQNYSDVAGKIDNGSSPGTVNDVLSPLLSITAVVSNFTLDTKARYTATVNLGVREVEFNGQPWADPQKALGEKYSNDFLAGSKLLNFSEKNAIVANGWSANGPGSLAEHAKNPERMTVYNQVRGLTPTSILKPSSGVFKDVLNVLNKISLIFFPELSTLDLGRIEVDQVPKDRLQ